MTITIQYLPLSYEMLKKNVNESKCYFFLMKEISLSDLSAYWMRVTCKAKLDGLIGFCSLAFSIKIF